MLAVTSFIGFTGLVALISYLKTRDDHMNSSDDYFLAGRSLTAWVIAGSLILTNLSTEHMIGLNADAFAHTIAVMAWETTAALAMVLTALYFLPRYLQRGLTTIPEFLSLRFDQSTRVIATLLFLFSYVVAILPVVLLFGAAGLESLFNVSENLGIDRQTARWLMVWSIGSLGSLYAIFGGLKAVAISDTINGIGFLIAGLLIPLLGLMFVGDGNPINGWNTVYTAVPEKFDITGDEPGSFLPIGVLFTGMIVNQIFFWCTNQSIIQRALGAKNLKEGQKGVLIAAGFKILGPVIIVLPGVIAFYMFRSEIGQEDAMLAYPMLVKEVLPEPLVGFFAAVMVGAVLSTFNSVLNSSATLFSQGIYQIFMNKDASGKEVVLSGRVCSIVLAIAAMIAAPMIDTEGSLYNYLQKINATFFGPMLAVILFGFLTKTATARAAKIAMITGPAIFYLFVFAFGEEVQNFAKSMFNTNDEIHFLHFLALVFLITSTLVYIVSKIWPEEYVERVNQVVKVDLEPWKHAKLVSIIICLIVFAVYYGFSQ
ncbi:solute:sodium symporter family transporter [Pseudemcibacter aquimaris]|uniref:solute:sodium symporter family transporter n=1 Tax=Pseudemcibacter aquimaris TaxID=2857064 RepID=UPI002011D4A1|nr:solute:sodium symporter family transporter [Pseudemcibacter aquimaris]MCC3861212.1 solute:sodium symporter family transporter [Pseudemcibacter aquimaris]WDU57987.1 solute:sodium symporter family transporter [Pseudemcibacter aquimaris]